jgi:hypothetical protein
MTLIDERPHYKPAAQELADALEGTAPALAGKLAGDLGPARTAELAKAIARAVSIGVRRYAEHDVAQRLAELQAIVEKGIAMIPPECETPDHAPEFAPDPDEAEKQARIDRFMAGGNDA